MTTAIKSELDILKENNNPTMNSGVVVLVR